MTGETNIYNSVVSEVSKIERRGGRRWGPLIGGAMDPVACSCRAYNFQVQLGALLGWTRYFL